MKIVYGDITKVPRDIIIHQCNCVTTIGKGLSHTLFTAFPYSDIYSKRVKPDKPGEIIVRHSEDHRPDIIAFLAQYYPGKAKNSFDTAKKREEWFRECLDKMYELLSSKENVNKKLTIAFPYGIGCGLGGGNWSTYEKMLDDFAVKMKNTTHKIIIVKKQ